MKKTKHKYSTYLLIFLGVIGIFTALSYSLDVGYKSNQCTENQTLKVINGTWSCYSEENLTYAEGYYFNQTNPLTISFPMSGPRYNITGFELSIIQGMTFNKNGVDVNTSGLYKFDGSISFSGGNGGEYGFGMMKNNITLPPCGMARTASTTVVNNVGLTCIVYLEKGDHLNLVVRDANNPPQDINIYRMNINILKLRN